MIILLIDNIDAKGQLKPMAFFMLFMAMFCLAVSNLNIASGYLVYIRNIEKYISFK